MFLTSDFFRYLVDKKILFNGNPAFVKSYNPYSCIVITDKREKLYLYFYEFNSVFLFKSYLIINFNWTKSLIDKQVIIKLLK